jgi:S-(hydroxymethyl)glutathione dehydrogenase / alcohol dehydrogenase
LRARAAITNGQGDLRLDAVDLSLPVAREVLVEIKAAGICRTDIQSLTWGRPLIIGHEGAGVVAGVGPDVSRVGIGDRVVLNWAVPCGSCAACGRGDDALCAAWAEDGGDDVSNAPRPTPPLHNGREIERAFELGTISEFAIVDEAGVTCMPDGVSFESACIVGCSVMTGVGAVLNVAKPPPGASVAVLGCGGVGLNVIQAAVLCGAAPIVAIDRSLDRLDRARAFGATEAILAGSVEEIVGRMRQLTFGHGADYAFECTGESDLAFVPLRLVRHGGAALQLSGFEKGDNAPVDLADFHWNKTYTTVLYGGCVPERDFPRIFELHATRRLKLDELITRTYAFDETVIAIGDVKLGRVAKAVIRIDKGST